ncbi:Glycosyltransferase subfamily 4-like [Klenkia terrae]|nr:Glycosyltransferase subfamily 4-like [Klenkia terrae]
MERMLVSAAKHFESAKVDSFVLGRHDPSEFGLTLADVGYNVSYLRTGRWGDLKDIRTAIREIDPDIVHIHTEGFYLPTVIAVRMAAGRRRTVLRTVHNIFTPMGIGRLQRRVQIAATSRLVDAVSAPSIDVQENEADQGRHCRVISNWVADDFVRHSARGLVTPGRPPTMAIVGNCSSIKNHALAIRVAGELGHRIIHLGDESGIDEEETQLLDELAKAGRVDFRGVGDPRLWLGMADYFAMPSQREGMPVALAEALQVGLRCVVANRPGFAWSVVDNRVQQSALCDKQWRASVLSVLGAGKAESQELDYSAASNVGALISWYREHCPPF